MNDAVSSAQRVALVTGGTGGIGAAICERLCKEGFKVATNYRSEAKAADLQEQMAAKGCEVTSFKADITSFEECRALIDQVEADLGPIDVLVNNAGITRDTTLRKMTPDDWHAVINTNLDSVFYLTRNVITGMVERGYGRVINISSVNGQKGQMGQANYAAAKAGMHGFTMSVAQEVARKGVTVNTVAPGYVATNMVMAVPEAIRTKIIATIPVGRLGTPEDIASGVSYLASEEASFVTGSSISINGGQYMS